jgi:beta-lactamase class A
MTQAKIGRYSFITLLIAPIGLFAQVSTPTLIGKINYIIDTAGGKFGIGVQGVDFKAGLLINGEKGYPMQSVFKFPLALAILHLVDEGKLNLDQKFHILQKELDRKTWSPMLRDFPDQDLDISLSSLLIYAVSKSDNNACDFLFAIAGGPIAVNTYIHNLGVKDISIVFTEGEMEKTWKLQYKNWCKPAAMIQLLQLLYHQKLLTKQSNDFLVRTMTEIPGSSKRITAFLPPNTELIHKTGSSGMNEQGILAATNDVGIVTLPNGKHLAIVVFASDYRGPRERGEHIIAAISKEIWDYYITVQESKNAINKSHR